VPEVGWVEVVGEDLAVEVVEGEERGSAPDEAPAVGEHRRVRGVLDGEARDDVA
jgi:hypothetical protein